MSFIGVGGEVIDGVEFEIMGDVGVCVLEEILFGNCCMF